MRKLVLLFAVILASGLLLTGCQTTTPKTPSADKASAPVKKSVSQDPTLRITTQEVMALFAEQFGDAPLVKETLMKNQSFVLIDARPANKFEAGHVPGAVNIRKPMSWQNIGQLQKDKPLLFDCGGLHCVLSSESAKIAIENGFNNVKVWYEGMPGWKKAGNYAEIEVKAVEKLVMKAGKKPYVLIDARPAVKYQKSFIPSAISLPKAEFELKKGLLPNDKSVPLIFYCGGYKCELSHRSAKLALGMGYKAVSVFAAGQPAWKKAKLPLWGNEASGVKKKKVISQALPEAISAKEFNELAAAGKLFIVDVRSAEDYATSHIPGSIHIYDEDFIFKANESVAKLPKEGRVVLHCATSGRAGGAYYAILGETDYANKNNLQYLDDTITINPDGTFEIGGEH